SLRLVAPGPNPACYGVRQSNFTATSLAVYDLVDSSPDNTIRVGTGSYYVIWTGTEWQLCRSDGGALTVLREEKSIGFQTEWILCVFENRLLFCADGIPIFNYAEDAIGCQPHGVELGLQKPAAFSQLLVVEDLSVAMVYSDGLGRAIQQAAMESGNSAILTAWLYDERGSKAIAVKPSRITVQDPADPFSYFAHYVTNAGFGSPLWSGAPMEGPAADRYHSEDVGYPFVRKVFEASPRRRI